MIPGFVIRIKWKHGVKYNARVKHSYLLNGKNIFMVIFLNAHDISQNSGKRGHQIKRKPIISREMVDWFLMTFIRKTIHVHLSRKVYMYICLQTNTQEVT